MKTLHRLPAAAAVVCALVILPAFAAGEVQPQTRPQTKSNPMPRNPTLHDPTLPLAAPARKPGAESPSASAPARIPRLQMVLISEPPEGTSKEQDKDQYKDQRRLALIDDELVAEGESVKGLRVLSIRKEAVIIATPNGPRTLPLATDTE